MVSIGQTVLVWKVLRGLSHLLSGQNGRPVGQPAKSSQAVKLTETNKRPQKKHTYFVYWTEIASTSIYMKFNHFQHNDRMISGMIGSPFSLDYCYIWVLFGKFAFMNLEVVIQVIFIGQFNISFSLFDKITDKYMKFFSIDPKNKEGN